MSMWRVRLLFAVVAGANALAAPPVVSILSTGPLSVNETLFYAPGVFSWPLFQGDKVGTQDDAAVILFPDQSRIRLGSRTAIRVEQHEAGLRIRLLFGALRSNMAAGSRIAILVSDKNLPASQIHRKVVSVQDGQWTLVPDQGEPRSALNPEALMRRLPWDLGVLKPNQNPE